MSEFKATITGKRQITIPMEVCKVLGVKASENSKLVFKINNTTNEVTCLLEKKNQVCFACMGEGVLDNNTCFICNGHCVLPNDIEDRVYEFIGYTSMMARAYGVTISIINEIEDGTVLDLPIIRIKNTGSYSKVDNNKIEIELQTLINGFETKYNTK